MTDARTTLKDRILDHDDELRDLLELLLQRANRRQLWLTFIDERGCLGDPLMPMDDYPDDPAELITTEDLGEVTQAHLLMQRMGMFREITGNASVVLVWERLGSAAVDADDRAWARAMRESARTLDVPLRAQFVLHGGGVRQLHPDDYV